MNYELLSNSQIDNVNAFSHSASASGDIQKISMNLRVPCCPEPDPSEKILLTLEKFGISADIKGNIKGTKTHFETCRKKLVNEINKGNIGFLSDKLVSNCIESSECKNCVDAFNSAIISGSKQYASSVPEMYGDFDSNTYDNSIDINSSTLFNF